MANMTLVQQILTEGGDLKSTEIRKESGDFICFAGDEGYPWDNISASDFKLFPVENGTWVAYLKRGKNLLKNC